uniref:Putative secreted protein n=1 Tax=Panstrongylus lignarius TaxID=156445 RepID=A0A224XU16_9HEMI
MESSIRTFLVSLTELLVSLLLLLDIVSFIFLLPRTFGLPGSTFVGDGFLLLDKSSSQLFIVLAKAASLALLA